MDMDFENAHRWSLRTDGYGVRDRVQARGTGVRKSKGLYRATTAILPQPDLDGYKTVVADEAKWQAMVDTCLRPAEAFLAPASAYQAQPCLDAVSVTERASITATYFRQMDEIHEQFPNCEEGRCGDGDACRLLDDTLAMVSRNIDLHYRQAQARKFARKRWALFQPAWWAALAAGGIVFDTHMVHLNLPEGWFNHHGLWGAGLVAGLWGAQQMVARFHDREAHHRTTQAQTELEHALDAATIHAGDEIRARRERQFRLMESFVALGTEAKQAALLSGTVQASAPKVAQWLRLYKAFDTRFHRLHEYLRASTPLLDICYTASKNEANRNNAILPLDDDFHGIPRDYFRRGWYVASGAVITGLAIAFAVTHNGVDLSHDFTGATMAAAIVAAAASSARSLWRGKAIDTGLAAPILPEFIEGLSHNLVGKLASAKDLNPDKQDRRMKALKDGVAMMIQGYPQGSFFRPPGGLEEPPDER